MEDLMGRRIPWTAILSHRVREAIGATLTITLLIPAILLWTWYAQFSQWLISRRG
jgi:hypothetical protein